MGILGNKDTTSNEINHLNQFQYFLVCQLDVRSFLQTDHYRKKVMLYVGESMLENFYFR